MSHVSAFKNSTSFFNSFSCSFIDRFRFRFLLLTFQVENLDTSSPLPLPPTYSRSLEYLLHLHQVKTFFCFPSLIQIMTHSSSLSYSPSVFSLSLSLHFTCSESVHHLMAQGMTPAQFLSRCSFFSLMWMLTNYLLVYTLRTLDVTVVMSLFACTVTLVYLLSWVVLHHQFVGIRVSSKQYLM